MKTIKSLLTFGLSAVTALTITSCQDFDFMDEAEIKHDLTMNEYTSNFEARYGKIDPNHNWGFESLPIVSLNGAFTRAGSSGAGSVYVNTNQWAEAGQDEYIENIVVIPGYPNFDNYYYANNGQENKGYIGTNRPNDGGNTRPCGDVTDYEVQYVSEFFRSHNKEQLKQYEQTLHLTDFFIQNVSAENDRESYPNGALKNEILNDGCNFGMEHLVFKTMESHDEIDGTWTHMNNYNRNATNIMTDVPVYYSEQDKAQSQEYVNNRPEWMSDEEFATHQAIANGTKTIKAPASIDTNYKTATAPYSNDATPKRQIKYVTSSGTEDFGYQSTWSTAKPFKKEWVLVKLTWMEKGQDGVERPREGYYLAFDYEAEKEDANVPSGKKTYGPDGYYSNWIVKITPAYGQETPDSPRRRIMCEDLGNTLDFDFNDVVYDVYYETNGSKTEAVITLQAAGGTLPIFVGVDPSKTNYEAHALFNQASSTPVNVGGTNGTIAIYRVEVSSGQSNPDYLPVYVQTSANSASNTITLKPSTGNGTAIAPQKFSVPVGVRWMKERMQIESSYKHFDSWVNDKNFSANEQPWFGNANIESFGNIMNIGGGVTSDSSEKTEESIEPYSLDEDEPQVVESETKRCNDNIIDFSNIIPTTGTKYKITLTIKTEGLEEHNKSCSGAVIGKDYAWFYNFSYEAIENGTKTIETTIDNISSLGKSLQVRIDNNASAVNAKIKLEPIKD